MFVEMLSFQKVDGPEKTMFSLGYWNDLEIFPKVLAGWLYNINHGLEPIVLINSLQWSVKGWQIRCRLDWVCRTRTLGGFLSQLRLWCVLLDRTVVWVCMSWGDDFMMYLHHCHQSKVFILKIFVYIKFGWIPNCCYPWPGREMMQLCCVFFLNFSSQ